MGFSGRIVQPPVRNVFRYWAGLGTGGSPPSVRDLDPCALDPEILPWLFLFRREADTQFRCLLSGTEIRQVDGYDSTGARLGDLFWARSGRQHVDLFEEVVRSALPLYYTGERVTAPDSMRAFASLLLPLAGRNGQIDHVFGVLHVDQPEPILPETGGERAGGFAIVWASTGDIVAEGASARAE